MLFWNIVVLLNEEYYTRDSERDWSPNSSIKKLL